MSNESRTVLVLFSGGRDCSLAACLLARDGHSVHLLTCDNGVSIGGNLCDYRYEELKAVLGDSISARATASTMGLFRRIALVDIEEDFARFKKNLIVLGSQLAIHSEAVVYCLKHNIKAVASGFTTYQQSFAEQMPQAIEEIRQFLANYQIEYLTPVSGYDCPDKVKFQLLDFGVSTKSLESVSIFADTFTDPTSDQVVDYIKSKRLVCETYINLKSVKSNSESSR
ncbi:MAG: hypothetical protein JNL18_22300 [Planctomycetaceae bacterium]|nr:hypothetical protein [Planctomycetaceae bacterium]